MLRCVNLMQVNFLQ